MRGFSKIKAKLFAGIGTTLRSVNFAFLNWAVIHSSKEGLARLFDAYIAGVIWRRYMQEGMQSWLDALPVDQSPISRIILPVSKVQSAVIELMNISDMPDSPERQVLAAKHLTKADVSSLASLRACGASLRFKPIQ